MAANTLKSREDWRELSSETDKLDKEEQWRHPEAGYAVPKRAQKDRVSVRSSHHHHQKIYIAFY